MTTYCFRIRFNISHKGKLNAENKDFNFKLANGYDARLISEDTDSIATGSRFSLRSCGYKDFSTAMKQGEIAKESLLYYAVDNSMGINLGKDVASASLNEEIKDKILKKKGERILDDIHGLCVYPQDVPTYFFSVHGAGIVNPRDMEFFSNELNRTITRHKSINAKVKLAMELLSFSFFDRSSRSKFLTLISATESLIEPCSRTGESIAHVNQLIDLTKNSTLPDSEKSSIINSLKWLLDESISRSLKKMAEIHLPDNTYSDLKAPKFIIKCYTARCDLVHKGYVQEDEYDINLLAANLSAYLKDMVTKIVGK
ncbi:HEPN domain-containing protein [Candidatus Thiodiazotropha sp. CDECU1]|uniref:HEPN domain-containing protein n=1 Tax=Candidatus Thiodiazotropha sp. CDECU1 TaxID=3065865 RepID=UPI00292CC4B2|nr:HEPN domain-containing protein [Candidatus Thiodiazotropha sp. CDECU1]